MTPSKCNFARIGKEIFRLNQQHTYMYIYLQKKTTAMEDKMNHPQQLHTCLG